ncbi:MAG: type II toxin-antitoxin system RelE/ParE family toxin [Bacteroidetes bacterium]|nr:type II toxin-antitoxin system RelE/ParE family toxin [Bacteroidota bacterium]
MAEIVWSNVAKLDLQDIYDYISEDSEIYALRLVDKIIERVEILKQMPKAGKKVAEFDNENLRELIEVNYRIIYQITNENIEIARIYHGARLLQ